MLAPFLLAQDGTTVYTFLNLPISARQAALGEAISVRDYDQNIAFVNPALLNAEMDSRISLNYTNHLADTHYGTVTYAKDLDYGHLLTVGGRYLDYGNMPRTDEYGNVQGNFSAIDASLGVGYAYQFEEEWTVGGNLNLISSKIDHYHSMAIAGSIAVAYHRKQSKETASFLVRNLGYQFKTYNGQRESLPVRIDFGYTKILDDFPVAITLTAHDLQKWNISTDRDSNGRKNTWTKHLMNHLALGMELFPEKNFNLRLGYNVKRGTELKVEDQRNFSGLAFGFGFKWGYFRFDYAHSRYHNAANMNQIGIALDFIELSGYRR